MQPTSAACIKSKEGGLCYGEFHLHVDHGTVPKKIKR